MGAVMIAVMVAAVRAVLLGSGMMLAVSSWSSAAVVVVVDCEGVDR